LKQKRVRIKPFGSTQTLLVPLAGLEPALMLLQGILRHLRLNNLEFFLTKIDFIKKCKKGAKLH